MERQNFNDLPFNFSIGLAWKKPVYREAYPEDYLTPAISRITDSSVGLDGNSPTIVPSRMTITRVASDSSSGSSLDTKSTAFPSAAKPRIRL